MNTQTKQIKNSAIFTITAAVVMLQISACATLSKEECLAGNWQAIGYSDGVDGHYPNHIDEHRKACAKVGVIPDRQAWERGRKQGLLHYCTKTNAYQIGLNGLRLSGVCPADKIDVLQRINANGLEISEKRRQLSADKDKIADYREKLRKLRSGDMLDSKTEQEAREYLLELSDKIHTLEERVRNTQRVIDEKERHYRMML
ncbi:MAG: hypothetical protein CSA44_00555 [Gammaproteobacteria bacterium]|nr:MAG: hypothetical protein CSA44_00555 [Gammaproteobacteria bacterium]